MEWVASTHHTTSELGVSSITTADAHTSAASSRMNWRPCRFSSVSPKDEIWFLRVCHHISNAVYLLRLWPECVSCERRCDSFFSLIIIASIQIGIEAAEVWRSACLQLWHDGWYSM